MCIRDRVKFGGYQDVAGGGHFSGRLTAPLCIAGGICKQLLAARGIEVICLFYTSNQVCGAGEALIVSEDTVWPLYGETVLSSMKNAGFDVTSFTFPHGEQSKNLSVYAEILNALAARHISRKGLIVALGGGVTGDRCV